MPPQYDVIWFFSCTWLVVLLINGKLRFLELSVCGCGFALTKIYFSFLWIWCSSASLSTFTFLFHLITSFSQQSIVFGFGSWCCIRFSIIPLWFISSFVNVMCYALLCFFMNVMLCRPGVMEYDFSPPADYSFCSQIQYFAFWNFLSLGSSWFNKDSLRFFLNMIFYSFSVMPHDFSFLLGD